MSTFPFHSCWKKSDKNIAKMNKRQDLGPLESSQGFVLDNTICGFNPLSTTEPTSALAEKVHVLQLVESFGVKHIILASFKDSIEADALFLEALQRRGHNMEHCFGFTEPLRPTDSTMFHSLSKTSDDSEAKVVEESVPDFPVGLQKLRQYGVPNPIIELDLLCQDPDPVRHLLSCVNVTLDYVLRHLSATPKVLIHLKDFPRACACFPSRVLELVACIAGLTRDRRPLGLIFQDTTGTTLPAQLAQWSSVVRRVMCQHGWGDGQLLVHVCGGMGLAQAAVMECLGWGKCSGVWSPVCSTVRGQTKGGGASQVGSLTNLARCGNQRVVEMYNFPQMRKAAREIHKLTTGSDPSPDEEIIGEDALEARATFGWRVSSFHSSSIGNVAPLSEFDLNELFSSKRTGSTELTTFPTALDHQKNVKQKLELECSKSIAEKMQAILLRITLRQMKFDHKTHMGTALLFESAGGSLTDASFRTVFEAHRDIVETVEMAQLRNLFYSCRRSGSINLSDDGIMHAAFYECFLKKFFGCPSDPYAVRCVSMFSNESGQVKWKKLQLRAVWALFEHRGKCRDPIQMFETIMFKLVLPMIEEEKIAVNLKDKARSSILNIFGLLGSNAAQSISSCTQSLTESDGSTLQRRTHSNVWKDFHLTKGDDMLSTGEQGKLTRLHTVA